MMNIFSVIAFTALFVAIISLLFAIKGRHSYYWLAALGMYIFSFLAGFSGRAADSRINFYTADICDCPLF